MDDKAREQVNKEIDKTIKRASEEVRGRELTPDSLQVRVVVRTKEGANIFHFSDPVSIVPPPKK